MDASYNDIEIVEDDMGEGYMDPIEENENLMDRAQRKLWKAHEAAKLTEYVEYKKLR
jgi:hypothetical protein